MQFIELLKEVQDVVWSAVIASVITLAGVMLSYWSNTQPLMRKLAHDAHEKEKERSTDIRRDVNLKATVEMDTVGSYFGGLPHRNRVKDNLVGEVGRGSSRRR